MSGSWYAKEHRCSECGEAFWAVRRAAFCSASCRARGWRKRRAACGDPDVADLCKEVLARRREGSASYSKLYPRLFRALAAELRRAGWDPVQLLLSRPREPIGADEAAAGGIEGRPPERRKWLFEPSEEIDRLLDTIEQRREEGLSFTWHLQRLELLRRWLDDQLKER